MVVTRELLMVSKEMKSLPNLFTALPDGKGSFAPCPELMTESEVIQFLRIPEVSNSKNYHYVIEHLKKFRNLPRIHICRKALYPRKAVLEWIEKETNTGK